MPEKSHIRDYGSHNPINFISTKIMKINFHDLSNVALCYINEEHLKSIKAKFLFEKVLPLMELTIEDIKKGIIIKELRQIVCLPPDDYVIMEMISNIVNLLKKQNPEKTEPIIPIQEIREKLSLNEIEVDDETVLEVYKYIKIISEL